MLEKISVVINTLNEEKSIKRAIESVKWADEIIICDMHSEDETVAIAKKLSAKVFLTKRLEYVEPARNFAISKASNDWILIIDPDEEVSETLKDELMRIASSSNNIDFVRLPRKNIIFGQWVKDAMWWPDYNIRFFKKGSVVWNNKIHRPPSTTGEGLDIVIDERYAIIHHHYESIGQFVERMLRYTKIQAEELNKEGYIFDWKDLISKPVSEFLSRFFLNRGFEDGLHGLVLSLLQSFSFLILYIRLWEISKYKTQEIELSELRKISLQIEKDMDYWFNYSNLSKNPVKRLIQKAKNKL